MGRNSVASTSHAKSRNSIFFRRHQQSSAVNYLMLKRNYTNELEKINDVGEMRRFLLERAMEDALLFALVLAPDKVPLMVDALLELGDLERCKFFLHFQDRAGHYTPFMLAFRQDNRVANKVFDLVEYIGREELASMRIILTAKSKSGRSPLVFLMYASMSEDVFAEQLYAVLGFYKSLDHIDLIELLSQSHKADEKENILMIMCRKRPGFLNTLMSDLLHESVKPDEFTKLLLQKNVNGQSLLTYAAVKLSTEDFKIFLNQISEQGVLLELLKNNIAPEPMQEVDSDLPNQVAYCFELGTFANKYLLLKTISQMEPEQQEKVITYPVLECMINYQTLESLNFLKEVFEHLTPCIKKNHPEIFKELLQHGLKQSESDQALKHYFIDRIRLHNYPQMLSRTCHQNSGMSSNPLTSDTEEEIFVMHSDGNHSRSTCAADRLIYRRQIQGLSEDEGEPLLPSSHTKLY